ncbi:uncharacterized protein LOC135218494 isoform X2 [Macrobrachium nipponense]|uniref:uncharacterized protein LOC135218494 isoform X2 n=1 Tax=Macrobrachium nipponense TaxID=159736 RepID=UPI0030C88BC6
MPRRNQPESLQKSAMVSIAKNFDFICYQAKTKEQMHQMIQDETYLDIEGPFVHMPSSILTELLLIFQHDTRCSQARRTHYHMLIQSHLEDFKMSAMPVVCFQFIEDRCKRLKRLDLSYMRVIRPPAFLRLIPNLSHVVVLTLRMTETTDQLLGLIGRQCPELRELDISNTPITEAGLTRLCYDAENDKPLCQKLLKLSIMGCIISARPVSFLLQYIPTLLEIDYDNIFEVFGVMKEWGLTMDNLESLPKYHLRILNSSNEIVDPVDVHIACTLCPYATNFTLSNAFVDNEILYKAMVLENLAHLRITNGEGLTLNFHEGVLPVLTVKGHQLQSLLLANFTSIDIAVIGECCPRLQNLAVSNITVYEEIMYPREHLYNHLTGLEVWSDLRTDTLNIIILKQLLTYCLGLEKLLVRNTDALSDKLLYDIWKENPMKNLFRLTVDNCPNVTASSIHDLLDMNNDLTLIRVWGCFFITKDDNKTLQKRIKDENCDLYLEWFGWTG